MYKCPGCKIEKPESEFHRSSRIKRGFAYYCRTCQNSKNKVSRDNWSKNGPSIIRDSKVCSKCNNHKPISQFSKNKNTADGYTSYCKPCWVIITRKAQIRQLNK